MTINYHQKHAGSHIVPHPWRVYGSAKIELKAVLGLFDLHAECLLYRPTNCYRLQSVDCSFVISIHLLCFLAMLSHSVLFLNTRSRGAL